MANLAGIVAVVTGATRGAGLGIAEELGASGATVYVTGRSTRGSRTENLPGSVEEAAEAVTRAGGRGIGVRCDHTREAEVVKLAEHVRSEGRLDLLVNNAWGGYEGHDLAAFTKPLWDQPVRAWEAMFTSGVLPTLLTSSKLLPLLLNRHQGLVVNTVAWLEGDYLGNVYYDAAKAAILRATRGIATECRDLGVGAVALAPGFLRTERVMAAHAKAPFDLGPTESPRYIGRAVAALAADPGVFEHTGELLYVGDLAGKYGFTDVDGRRPPKLRSRAR